MNEAIKQRLEKVEDNSVEEYNFVKVVRCKDCKYFAPNKACNLLCGLTFPTPNSYCSYGERKETE